MPGTIVTEEIELIHSDKGPGGGDFSGDGGDGGDTRFLRRSRRSAARLHHRDVHRARAAF